MLGGTLTKLAEYEGNLAEEAVGHLADEVFFGDESADIFDPDGDAHCMGNSACKIHSR